MSRILHYMGSLNHGGIQSAVMNLYRHIDREAFQFDFISHYSDQNQLQAEIESLGGRVFFIEPLRGANAWSFRASWRRFFEGHPAWEVLHSHMRSTASIVVPVAKACGLATIVHAHSTSNGSGVVALAKDALQLPVRWQADFMVGCSSESGRWMFGKQVCGGDRYTYLPNAIEPDRYAFDPAKREACRRELGLEDGPVFGHVGRLHESKNHAFLLRVFRGLLGKYPGARLLLVGDGPLRAEIEADARVLGIADSVTMAGDQYDVAPFLCAMDCFLFPSRWEGLPVTVVEALASGLPCYVSDTITHDIDIAPAVHMLPIDDPAIWVSGVELGPRVNAVSSIRGHGFDIEDSVRVLEELYGRAISLAERRRTAN